MKQIFNIQREPASADQDKTLSVRIGEKHFGFAVTTQQANELICLVWYAGEETWSQELEEVFHDHPELKQSYAKTVVAYDHPQSVLIPAATYTGDDRMFLELMYGVNGGSAVFTEDISGWQVKNIFAVPQTTKEWATRHFPSAHFYHNYSIGIRLIDNTASDGSILLDFRSQDFTLIASKGNRLLMAQTFTYSTPADVIYYLVKVCNEFGLSQQSVRVSVTGLIEKESNLYRELTQYFIHLRLREPAWLLSPKEEEGEIPPHFFTSLNDLAVCES